jgi:hypothetical protein
VAVIRCLAGLLVAATLWAQAEFFPLKDVRPGLQGTGRTVFSGSRIEEFQVEVLGILENVGPKQSLILARLSGGPMESTGVLQGMSGSPVYIDGRLVGAVSMGFPFSKEPVAGIRPIEEVLRAGRAAPERPLQGRVSLWDRDLTRSLARPESVLAGGSRMVEIATPLSFGGFTRNTIGSFAVQLRSLGLEPSQGISGGGRPGPNVGDPSTLVPGAMISVQLLSGDMSIGASGTVTHVDGQQLYAFGHRFLSIGRTELPFARAEVLTLLPNLASSFKISAPREWMGTITQDRSTAVAGELGRRAALAPLSISVTRRPSGDSAGGRSSYQMEMVNDRFLSPFLVQMAVFSAIDATERTVGSSSLAVRGEIEFQDGTTPIRLSNMYAGQFGLPLQVSLAAAVPLAYALQSGFENLQLKNVRIEIESYGERKQMQIDQVWASRRTVRPGEEVKLTAVLLANDGAEATRNVTYRVPVGAPTGPLYFTVADGNTTNLAEYRQLIVTKPRSPSQLVAFLNSLRSNTKAYVRIWRQDPSYDVQGQHLPAPPPSVEQILARTQTALGSASLLRNSKVAELEIDAGDVVVTGAKTVQVEVKE